MIEPNHKWQTMLSIVDELHCTIAGDVLNFIAGALVHINSDDFVHTHSFLSFPFKLHAIATPINCTSRYTVLKPTVHADSHTKKEGMKWFDIWRESVYVGIDVYRLEHRCITEMSGKWIHE